MAVSTFARLGVSAPPPGSYTNGGGGLPIRSASGNGDFGGLNGATAQEEIYRKIHELESRLAYMERREQEGWQAVSAQVASILEASRSSTAIVGNLEIRMSKDVAFVEETTAKDLALEVQRRTESEQRLRQAIADEATHVRSTLEAAERQRTSDVDARLAALAAQASGLCKTLEERVRDMSSALSASVAAAEREATKVEERLAAHRSTRETAEMNVLQVLEETCVQLHRELMEERALRVESHKRLERLLLETGRKQWTKN